MRYFIVLFFIIFFIDLSAQQSAFKLENGDESEIRITFLPTAGISNAELYRETGNGDQVIIFEFMQSGESFIEKAEPGTCYFLKIYSEDGNASTTEKQCYSGIKYLVGMNNGSFMFMLLMILSAVLPFFMRGRFIDNYDSDYAGIMKQVILMMDEGGRKLSVSTQPENRHSMLFYMASFLASALQKSRPDYSMNDNSCMPGDNNGFAVKVTGGYMNSGYNEIYRRDRKEICFSSTVAGMGMDAVNGKRCIVSIEPFLAGVIFAGENKKGFKPSGAYIFIIAVSILIIVMSILKTVWFTGGAQ